MADVKRPKATKVDRRLDYRRPVPAGFGDGWPGDDDPGSAGTREPRHPKPSGPLADAGELPMPAPRRVVTLLDPRL